MQEDPLPPEESLRGSSPKAASWPAGEAVCAGSPGRGDATAFQLSLQQLPIAGMAPGAMLTQQSKATKAGNNARKSSLAFQHLPGRCPSSCIKFFFLPPHPPHFQPERKKSWRWKQRAASPSSGGEQSKESTVWSPLSQPRVWVILPHSDKPDTPIPGPLSPTEGLLLGQSPSLPAAAGSKATAKNSTFA